MVQIVFIDQKKKLILHATFVINLHNITCLFFSEKVTTNLIIVNFLFMKDFKILIFIIFFYIKMYSIFSNFINLCQQKSYNLIIKTNYKSIIYIIIKITYIIYSFHNKKNKYNYLQMISWILIKDIEHSYVYI